MNGSGHGQRWWVASYPASAQNEPIGGRITDVHLFQLKCLVSHLKMMHCFLVTRKGYNSPYHYSSMENFHALHCTVHPPTLTRWTRRISERSSCMNAPNSEHKKFSWIYWSCLKRYFLDFLSNLLILLAVVKFFTPSFHPNLISSMFSMPKFLHSYI